VEHAVLTGEYELSIDEKGRLLIPADLRRVINPDRDGTAFFLTVTAQRKPCLYPERYFERLVSQKQQELTPDTDTVMFDQMYFALATRVEPDGQGRILVPAKTSVEPTPAARSRWSECGTGWNFGIAAIGTHKSKC